MATCIDTQTNQLSRDPNRSSSDKDRYQFMNFCRRSFSNQVSCAPICQNRTKTTQTCRIMKDLDPDEDLWLIMQDKAGSDIDDEPILSNYYHSLTREVPT
ncbi:serine acetyltransferase 1 [Pyrus ussuriensis x Pyrus communis]|uniref:Serine acetyltransferase 1 n=1 Tax=Pyrus ussuriensis x Pyrus communis TaxID=2448454 RepID=A0A5N5GE97_9ROSA|nr:serine acetyltransferase 1 [Pyrus ussuriensis x Pyrus communis]